jgi:branched-chain amino acid transport system permease protein
VSDRAATRSDPVPRRRPAAGAFAALCLVLALGASWFAGAAAQDAPDGAGPRIVATLTVGDPPAPVAGVELVVALDGVEVGRGTSGPDGVVAVELPGPGQYDVTLDPETFPDGIGFAPDSRSELSPRVQASGDRTVVFRLARGGATGSSTVPDPAERPGTGGTAGTGGADSGTSGGARPGGASTFERLANLVASGTRFGLIIALAAVGLSLIFGTTGLTNFAHGEMIAFGGIAAWYLNSNNGGLGIPLVLAAVGAVVLTGAFGASFELGVYRPLRRRGMPVVSQMVISIGLALALRYLFSIVFGSSTKQYSQFATQPASIRIGPLSLTPKDLVISGVALVVLVLFGLFLQRSRLGTAIRAVSDNRDLSIASGIDDQRVVLVVWILAGALCGLGGVMLGSSEFVGWTMGQRVLLITFAAVLLGGLGTTFGAMVGGLFVGIVSDVSTFWLDADLKIVVALATLVVVLLVRPQGVFGVRARTA